MPPVPRQIPCLAPDHSPTTAVYKSGCSCPGPRAAWRAAQAVYNRQRRDPAYEGKRGGGPVLPRTPEQRAARSTEIRERNRALAVGASRRLRGLLRIAHGRNYLARRLKMSPGRVSVICAGTADVGIWPKTAMAIKALHQELQYHPGSSPNTAEEARRLRYLPPAAWHPDDLDNPLAGPTWPYRTLQQPRSVPA